MRAPAPVPLPFRFCRMRASDCRPSALPYCASCHIWPPACTSLLLFFPHFVTCSVRHRCAKSPLICLFPALMSIRKCGSGSRRCKNSAALSFVRGQRCTPGYLCKICCMISNNQLINANTVSINHVPASIMKFFSRLRLPFLSPVPELPGAGDFFYLVFYNTPNNCA